MIAEELISKLGACTVACESDRLLVGDAAVIGAVSFGVIESDEGAGSSLIFETRLGVGRTTSIKTIFFRGLIGDLGRADTGGEAVGACGGSSLFGASDAGVEFDLAATFDPRARLSSGLIPVALTLRRVGTGNPPVIGRGNLFEASAGTFEVLCSEVEVDELPIGSTDVVVRGKLLERCGTRFAWGAFDATVFEPALGSIRFDTGFVPLLETDAFGGDLDVGMFPNGVWTAEA